MSEAEMGISAEYIEGLIRKAQVRWANNHGIGSWLENVSKTIAELIRVYSDERAGEAMAREAKLREALERGVNIQAVNYGHATETHMALITWARYARAVLREEEGKEGR